MMRLLLTFLLAVAAAVAPAAPASAQLTGTGREECEVGELCGSAEVDESQSAPERAVVDPPGDHVTSLITIGLMAAVVGSYLVIALSGHNPFSAMLARRRAH